MKKTLVTLLENRIRETPDRVYLMFRKGKEPWSEMRWKEYGERIERFSRALIGYGIKTGDRVSVIGESSQDWFIVDMSIMTIGAITVPIYMTSSGEQIKYFLNHSEARILIVDDISYFQRIESMLKEIPTLEKVVLQGGEAPQGSDMLMTREAFEKEFAEKAGPESLRERRDAVDEDTICTFIYTSGTTGEPKAVMLNHKNYYAAGETITDWERFLLEDPSIEQIKDPCILTLAHVYERTTSLLTPMFTGACIYFANLQNILEEMKDIQPTIVVGLPRTWEKAHEAIMASRDAMPEKKQKIFDWALKVGYDYNQHLYKKKKIPFSLKFKHALAHKLVISKILDGLGFLSEAKHIMTGGAVSSKEIIDFFFSLGLWICQVYGQSEALGVATGETKDFMRFGSVGKPFTGVEMRIADDGEIMVKGGMVSAGYYKDPELTKETFKDGWLYSGDLGYIDKDGYVFITGRKKDIIITSGAKNITPAKIESSLMSIPIVEHAVVAGDGKKYLTALLTLSMEEAQNYAARKGVTVKSYEDLLKIEGIKEDLQKRVDEINQKFSRVEQVKKFRILSRPLSVEAGELTSLQKIKRYIILENNKEIIEKMYAEDRAG